MGKFYLVFYILFSLSLFVKAQQSNQLIDVNYKQASISQMVADLKSKTGYQFYYDPVQTDSLRVTLALTQKTLSFVLDKAFENTVYHYFITDAHEVILTKNLKVIADLAPGIFNNQPAPAVTQAPQAVVDYSEEKTVKVAEATTEN
ncbi:MAG: hypothetical protein JST50_19640, partial [Bacteroidetes bacterium]|nr:hypothetical protein [Bacteroidota bacterium]